MLQLAGDQIVWCLQARSIQLKLCKLLSEDEHLVLLVSIGMFASL